MAVLLIRMAGIIWYKIFLLQNTTGCFIDLKQPVVFISKRFLWPIGHILFGYRFII